jgi:hypothetical protein
MKGFAEKSKKWGDKLFPEQLGLFERSTKSMGGGSGRYL